MFSWLTTDAKLAMLVRLRIPRGPKNEDVIVVQNSNFKKRWRVE
jgi:hypothetical protein